MNAFPEKPLLCVVSQGCAANFGEGEKIAQVFEDENRIQFGLPQDDQHPEGFVLNVCTVKGNAGAIKLLRQAIAISPDAKIIITGCTPKDFREEALRITQQITFTDIKELARKNSNANKPEDQSKEPLSGSSISKGGSSEVLRESPLVGIVNIESGCLDACSYCSTRLVKGRLQSYPAEDIVQQVSRLVADGCREIQLTGQDCGCYGFDFREPAGDSQNATAQNSGTGSARGPRNLAELVQKILAEVPGDYRIRLGMGNPRHILRYKDALMDCFKDPRVYKFIHLPVQSGSESVLQGMNRKHTARDYADLAREFNERFPLFTLSTDLIVGFPGETDQDFADTLSILRETRPTVCNITRFVSRPGTPASHMTNPVPDEIKHKRSAELAAAFQEIAQQNNARWIGQTEIVTVEKAGYRKGTIIARNDAYRPVAIQIQDTAEIPPGTRLKVRITAAEAFALIAEPIF